MKNKIKECINCDKITFKNTQKIFNNYMLNLKKNSNI